MVNAPRDSDRHHDFVQYENGSVIASAKTGVSPSISIALSSLLYPNVKIPYVSRVANNVSRECVQPEFVTKACFNLKDKLKTQMFLVL